MGAAVRPDGPTNRTDVIGCTGFVPYPTRGAAAAAAIGLGGRNHSGPRPREYFCENCKNWHIGRPTRFQDKRRN